MMLISLPAANQSTFLCTFVIPALSLLPLLALIILVMKRRRPPPTRTDPEHEGSSEKNTVFDGASTAQSPPRKKVRARKAIPRRMQHMKNNMTVWGDRWLPAIQPSTAGSQQGEIDPSGMYTASNSPPPSYRTTPSPLSPVVMSSSPNPNPLSSDFTDVEDSVPLRSNSPPPFDKMFLFGEEFGENFADSFGKFDQADTSTDSAYDPFPDGRYSFGFSAEATSSHNAPLGYSAFGGVPSFDTLSASSFTPPRPDPFTTAMAPIELHSGIPMGTVPSNFRNFPVTYPLVPSANSFSDWIPHPTAQPGLPLDNATLFPDTLSSLPYPSPSQNMTAFPTDAWKPSTGPYHSEVGHTIPMVAGYSTPPMYTGHGSPYLAMSDGHYSPVYHRSGSGSPMGMYPGQLPQYYPHAPLSPLPTRTTSSGSVASMLSNNSPHAGSFRTMSGSSSDYSDLSLDYGYSSPHSAVFTGSPASVSSPYEGAYPEAASSASRTIPLPFQY